MVRVSFETPQGELVFGITGVAFLKSKNEKLLKLCVSTESNLLTFPHLSSSSIHLVLFDIVKSNCNKINQTKINNMPCLREFTFVISAYAPVEDYLHLNVCVCCKNAERQAP